MPCYLHLSHVAEEGSVIPICEEDILRKCSTTFVSRCSDQFVLLQVPGIMPVQDGCGAIIGLSEALAQVVIN